MTDDRRVAIARCHTYEDEAVAAALAEAFGHLGGMSAFVKPGDRVCLKPNLLFKAAPERAITTHPSVLRAVIREVRACGAAEVLVGESPAGRGTLASARAAWKAAGWLDVCEQEGATLVLFDEDVVRVENPDSSLFASFEIGRAAAEADVLISLPKLKTHGFQQFTGAVKNLFGCVPGLRKAQFHVKVPDRYDFGRMLVDLMLACRPRLAIMDGIVGMQGQGPGGGEPAELGLLLASPSCPALDVVASAIVGFEPLGVYTNRAAHERGLCPASADEAEVLGVGWREAMPETFDRPPADVAQKLPWRVVQLLRDRLVAKPYLGSASECTGCATCRDSCPVGAIEMRGKRPAFEYGRCIRCYCCQELCPRKCLRLKTPWLVRNVIARERGGG